MPITWNLKKWLVVERDIYKPSQLQTLLAEQVGIRLSLQAISALINGIPNALRLQTIQALCNALNCKLSDFCEVLPDIAVGEQKRPKAVGEGPSRLYGHRKKPQEKGKNDFPNPHDFINDDSE